MMIKGAKMVNWDKYKTEEISENLKYFCDYWEYMI